MAAMTLGWMRPTGAAATLARAADKLDPEYVVEAPQITPPVPPDFWGAVVLTYEAGRVISIEKRELK